MSAEVASVLSDAITADDYQQIIQVIERRWTYLLRTDDLLLRRALASLPARVAQEHPLAILIDELFQPMTPSLGKRGDPHIATVVDTLQALPDDHRRVSIGLSAVIALKRRGRFADALSLGRHLVEVADQIHYPDHLDLAHLVGIRLHVGFISLLDGDLVEAERLLGAVHRRHSPIPNHSADAAGKLALLYALQNESRQAQMWIERALACNALADSWHFVSLESISLKCAQALVALDRLDWSGYHEHIDSPDRYFPDEQWTFVLYVRARAALLLGNQRPILDQLQQYRSDYAERVPTSSYPRILLDTAEADLWMSLGQMGQARKLIARFGHHPLEVVTAARFHLINRSPAAAQKLTHEENWPARTHRRDRMNLLLLAATADLRSSPDSGTRAGLLRRAAAEAGSGQESWLHTLAIADRDLVRLVVLAHDVGDAGVQA